MPNESRSPELSIQTEEIASPGVHHRALALGTPFICLFYYFDAIEGRESSHQI